MITYLINFILCSGLLLLVYRLLLRNENLYRFNRFYLLFSLLFSLVVPLTTMELPAKIANLERQVIQPESVAVKVPVVKEQTAEQVAPFNIDRSDTKETTVAPRTIDKEIYQQIKPVAGVDYKPYLFSAFYLIITLSLLFRFTRNLYTIKHSVAQNEVNDIDGAKLVLVDEDVTPHSFLSYVFVNKLEYSSGVIEQEIICHEQTHVRQLHSLDVILVELFQAIFWFNPFIPFYRKAIQLNHEFLADEAVVKSYANTSAYQHLLLAKASQSSSLYLTSQFNYLTTKKRLIMMTKNTSNKIALYKRLALLPVLGGAVLIFSNKSTAMEQPAKAVEKIKSAAIEKKVPGLPSHIKYNHKPIPTSPTAAPQAILDEFAAILKRYNQPAANRKEGRLLKPFSEIDRSRLEVLFAQMSSSQQNVQFLDFFVPAPPPAITHPTKKQLLKWTNSTKYGVWIDGQRARNADLANYKPSDFDEVYLNTMWSWTKEDINLDQLELLTKANYAKLRADILAKNHWDIWHKIKGEVDRVMGNPTTKVSKSNASPFPDAAQSDTSKGSAERLKFNHKPIPPSATDAPQAVLDEFTAILKKYHQPAITKEEAKEVKPFSQADKWQLEVLYAQMSRAQQNDQWIAFHVPSPPPTRSRPTKKQLKDWQDAVNYGVWIDGKRIKNADLAEYKPSDFGHFFFSPLMPVAVKNDKFHFQVDLMTPNAFAKFSAGMLAKDDWDVYQKMKMNQ